MVETDVARPVRVQPGGPAPSAALAPFHHPAFAVLWAATVVSNIGTWMQNAAAGWLMTTLDRDPFVVSLVQVAASFPLFVFALPAGALADVLDRRRLLIGIHQAHHRRLQRRLGGGGGRLRYSGLPEEDCAAFRRTMKQLWLGRVFCPEKRE
jgi:hypothetical protein